MSDTIDDDDDYIDPLHTTPTYETYEPPQEAFLIFNAQLFDNQLPQCMIVLQNRDKRSHGYYSPKKWVDTKGGDDNMDVISLNPIYFSPKHEHGGTIQVWATLYHEMCHQWQYHFGNPGRGRYHNKEWGTKMKAGGLQPSHTGKPGGKEVGQQMTHYIIEGGPFIKLARSMIDDMGMSIPWAERDIEGAPKPPTRVSYVCPQCAVRVMGKRSIATLGCNCTGVYIAMDEVTEATAKPVSIV